MPKGRKKAAKAPGSTGPREGTKTAQVVAMLQRKNRATLEEIVSRMSKIGLARTYRPQVHGWRDEKANYKIGKSGKGERTYRIN